MITPTGEKERERGNIHMLLVEVWIALVFLENNLAISIKILILLEFFVTNTTDLELILLTLMINAQRYSL